MIEALFVKPTLVLAAALLLGFALRNVSAAARHLIYLCALIALLLLPAGTLLPVPAIALPAIVNGAAGNGKAGPIAEGAMSLADGLFAIWLCGALLFMGRLAVDVVRLSRLLRGSTLMGSIANMGFP